MRMLVTLGAVLAGPASAGTLEVEASVAGAGTVTESGQLGFYTPPCGQLPPVSDLDAVDCAPWSYPGGGTVVLVAAPAPGTQFDGWTECDRWHFSACELDVPPGGSTRVIRPRARFTDGTPPVVTALPTVARDGALVLDWKASEPGVTYECALDGAAPAPCAPP